MDWWLFENQEVKMASSESVRDNRDLLNEMKFCRTRQTSQRLTSVAWSFRWSRMSRIEPAESVFYRIWVFMPMRRVLMAFQEMELSALELAEDSNRTAGWRTGENSCVL